MKLSVAMCTYDGERYLPAQLRSIAGQSRRPDELVVCDDHSADETVRILEEFAAGAPFPVRLHVNARTLGVTANFEQAIARCSGDVIALGDQDDVWYADKLARLAAPFERSGVGLAFSDADLIDADGRPVNVRLWDAARFTPAKRRRARRGGLFDVLVAYNVVTGATMAFRARDRERVLPVPAAWDHDGWIALILAALAETSLIAGPLMQYRRHPRQATGVEDIGVSFWRSGRRDVDAWRSDASGRHARARARYGVMLDQLAAAQAHLATLTEARDRQRVLDRLAVKTEHIRARARLPGRPVSRVGAVTRELLSGRYHRYSLGLSSAARDLIVG